MRGAARKVLQATTLVLTAGAVLAAGAVAKPPDTQRNFVACPIVMETDDVPCWVAEYAGERYYLTLQTGRTVGADIFPFSPMFKHRVVVEGTVSDEPRICGGIVLRNARLSSLEEVEPGCGKMIPGEGYQTRGSRPIGPDGTPPPGKLATAVPLNEGGALVMSRAQKDAAYAKVLTARQPQSYTLYFFFNSVYLPFPFEQQMTDEAALYAADVNAARVEIVGYRGATILSNGERLEEKAGLGRIRAERLADIFAYFKVPRERIQVTWKDESEDQGGVNDYQRRRVTVRVIP